MSSSQDVWQQVAASRDQRPARQSGEWVNCPTCSKAINNTSFDDELSVTEFYISGLCQTCQNKAFQHED